MEKSIKCKNLTTNQIFAMGNAEGKKVMEGIKVDMIKEEDIAKLYTIYDKNKDGKLQKEEAYSLLNDVLTFYVKKAKEDHIKAKKESGGVVSEEEEKKL